MLNAIDFVGAARYAAYSEGFCCRLDAPKTVVVSAELIFVVHGIIEP
jgi:hypothetical protein